MSAPEMELRRAPEAEPIKPGWYYGRLVGIMDQRRAPRPTRVRYNRGHLSTEKGRSVEDYEWFGPVPICKESGT